MKKLRKKIVVIILSLFTILSSFPLEVFAEQSDYKVAVETDLNNYSSFTVSTSGNYQGLFYSMHRILRLAVVVDFAQKDIEQKDNIGMTTATVNTFRDKLVRKVQDFNKAFGEDGDAGSNEVTPITLNESYFNDKININGITTQMASYMNDYLDSIIPDKNMDSSRDDEVLEGRKKILSYCYDIIATTIDTPKECSNNIPYKSTVDSSGATIQKAYYSYDISSDCNKLYEIMDPKSSVSSNSADKDAKSRLLRKAKGITDSQLDAITANTIDSNLQLIDRFFEDGTFNSQKLSSAYYKLLACSAVYEPFVSMTGDSYFITALEQLTGSSGDSNDVLQLYKASHHYSKPLYYMSLDNDGNRKGSATRLTLEAFVDSIMNEKSGCLVMAKGVLEQKPDTDSYDYYLGKDAEWKVKDSVDASQQSNGDSNSSDDESPSGDNTNQTTQGGNQTTGNGNVNVNGSGNTAPLNNGSSNTNNGNSNTNNNGNSNTNNTTTGNNSSNTNSNNNNPSGANASQISYANAKEDTTTETDNSSKVTSYASDGDTISDKDNLTEPVFKWGVVGGKVSMGTVVMNNILRNVSKLETFCKEHTYLYMNPFGDIVTEDDIVILPGAANPTLYNKDKKYYPYTKAFFTSHPKLAQGTKTFKATNSSNLYTYILSLEATKDTDDKSQDDYPTIKGSEVDDTNDYKVKAYPLHNKTTTIGGSGKFVDMGIQADIHEIGEGITSMMMFKHYEFDAKADGWDFITSKIDGWFANRQAGKNPVNGSSKYQAYMVLAPSSSVTSNATSVLYLEDLENMASRDLGTMAEIFYYSLVDDNADSADSINDRFNMTLLAEDVLTEALNGITNKTYHTKNSKGNIDNYNESMLNSLENLVRDIMKKFLSNFSNITGVVGIKNAYQDPLLGKLVYYAKTYYFIFLAVILLVTILRVLRNSLRFSRGVVVALGLTLFSYAYVQIIPVYIPIILNAVQNNITLNLNYSIIGTALENYGKTYERNLDSKGNYIYSTTSLNLYRLSGDDMKYLAETYGDNFCDGTARVLNEGTTGVFLQGNTIKINLDVLVQNISIIGGYTRDPNNNKLYYKLESKKKVSSNLDYYTCYNLVLNNLIDTMNKHSRIYQLERGVLKYNTNSINPMTKDSFVFKSFIDSAVYLTPEDDKALANEVEPEILDKINEEFPNKMDWLGLENLLVEKEDEYKGSLWYDTMRDNGYTYDSDMDMPESDARERQNGIARVIEKTNRLTRIFVEKHRDEIDTMSDENALKMVALYATCILNQQCGSWYDSNMLYPVFLNYEEFNLDDIMVACFASTKDKTEVESLNIVDYVTYKMSVWATPLLAIAMILTYVSTAIINFGYSILYILAGIAMIYRFARSLDFPGLFAGYLKSTIIIFLCNLTQTVMLLLIKNVFGGGFFSIIFQIIIESLIVEVLLRLTYVVFRNPSELGNSQMEMVMPKVLQKLGVGKLIVKSGEFLRSMKGHRDATPFYEEGDAYREFRQDSTLGDLYNSRNLSRRRASAINNIHIDDEFFTENHNDDNQ